MSPENDHFESEPKLAGALRQLANEAVFVPPARDAAILQQTRKHFQSSRTIHLRRMKWLAIAASMLVAANLLFVFRRPSYEVADINRDGTVDILDAFLFTRRIQAGETAPDINRDGKVDSDDAAYVAQQAVRLKGGRS